MKAGSDSGCRLLLSLDGPTSDVRKWTTGVKIRQIAANAISGNYSFDMYQTCRTALPASPHLKGARQQKQDGQGPSLTLSPA